MKWLGPNWTSQPLRLVVLPFENLSGDPAEEYFGDALAGELTHALTRLRGLHVIARTSASALKGQALDVREIGRRLCVSAVVEGAVQRSADRLRITVSLIDAADASHLWSGRFDPRLGEAHGALGWVLWAFDWAWEEAEQSFVRAEELSPSYAQTRLWHSFLLASLSRFDEALQQIEHGWQLDPLSLVMQCNVAAILHLARRHEAAIERCLRTVEMDPEFALGNFHLGRAYFANGRYDLATAALEKAAPGFPLAMGALGSALGRIGRRDKALEILHQLEHMSEQRYVGHVAMFGVYSGLGELDAAIEQLSKAFHAREGVVPILPVDPALDSVRDDPRVKALLRRLKLPRVRERVPASCWWIPRSSRARQVFTCHGGTAAPVCPHRRFPAGGWVGSPALIHISAPRRGSRPGTTRCNNAGSK